MWSLTDREEKELIAERLQKREGVSVDDYVQLRDPCRRGIVKYIGRPEFSKSGKYLYGIYLDKKYRGTGKTNGTVKNVQYFQCEEKRGIFVRRDEIQKVIRRVAQTNFLERLRTSKNRNLRFLEGDVTQLMLKAQGIRKLFEKLDRNKEFRSVHEKAKNKSIFKLQESGSFPSPKHFEKSTKDLEIIDENHEAPTITELMHKGLETETTSSEFETLEETSTEDISHYEQMQKVKKRRTRTWADRNDSCMEMIEFYEQADTENEWAHRWADDELNQELEEDPVLWCLSKGAREHLSNPTGVARLLHDLERCTSLIDRYIPEMTNLMSSQTGETVYMTNVIQELLKRCQQEGLSKKIRNDFSHASVEIDAQDLYTDEDVQSMVELMGWIRNNITAAAVTDEMDAKMASMAMLEMKSSLKHLLHSHTEKVGINIKSGETPPPAATEPESMKNPEGVKSHEDILELFE